MNVSSHEDTLRVLEQSFRTQQRRDIPREATIYEIKKTFSAAQRYCRSMDETIDKFITDKSLVWFCQDIMSGRLK